MSTASWPPYGDGGSSSANADADAEGGAPSSTPAAAFFPRAKPLVSAFAAARRPWREVVDIAAFARPYSVGEARARAGRNLRHFRANYALAALVIVFLSLLWRPVSMVVFLFLFAAWLFLYLARDEPLVVMRSEVDDRVVLAVLGAVTAVALVLSSAAVNVLVALVIAAAVITLHAVFRATDDLYIEEREAADGGLFSFVDSHHKLPTAL